MTQFLRLMTTISPVNIMAMIFLPYPVLAFAPAALFRIMGQRWKKPWIRGAGITWALYGVYEFLMRYRILCSGDCNIRIDLLLIYPLLLALSVAAIISALRAAKA